MFRDEIIAAIRTACAVAGSAVITALLTWATRAGIEVEIDGSWELALSGMLFAFTVGGYNLVVNWATRNIWDGFGWLLGYNVTPEYGGDSSGEDND